MRALRILGWAMIWTGALIFAFLAYQLFGTRVMTARAQNQAEQAFEQRLTGAAESLGEPIPITDDPVVGPRVAPVPQNTVTPIEVPLLYPEASPEVGEPVGRITITTIGLDKVLMEGVGRATLKTGPGHMPWTPLPGQPGNAVISGHRTTYGAPFGDIDQLNEGDLIIVETLRGMHTYAVRHQFIVEPTDVWVTEERAGAWLTLTTCHPRFSARERLIVVAELVDGPNLEYALVQRDAFEDIAS